MDSRLKPYEDYFESEANYIGKYPAHWKITKLRFVFEERKEKNIDKKERNILSVMRNKGVVPYSEKGNVGNKHSEDIERYNLVYKDDIVMNSMNVIIGSVGRSKYNGALSPVYYVLKNRNYEDFNVRYYENVFRMTSLQRELTKYGKGILAHRMRIPIELLKNLELPLPPKEEQDQIVRYLDSKLSKINKFIKTRKKQIELLKELKQAIINEAVTKGLEPNVKMKTSGIEWLGDIPEGWEVRRLSQISKIVLSGLDKKSYENQKNVRLCNYVDVYKNNYITNDLDFMVATATDNEIQNYTLLHGDIIITKDSESWDDIGVPAYVDEELINVLCGYHLAIIRVNSPNLISEFIYNAFLSDYVANQYKVKAKGVTRFGLSYQHIHDTNIIIPPKEQQLEIASYIKAKSCDIDITIQKIQKEIDLIAEYRTTLISDVVTGKVDVRHIEVEDTIEGIEEDFEDLEEGDIEEEIKMGEE